MQASDFISTLRPKELNSFFVALPEGAEHGQPVQYHQPYSEVEDELYKLNGQGYGIFVCVNDIKQGKPRRADDVTRIRALFIDIDDGREMPEFTIEPSMVVQTSTKGKYHVYWLVNDCDVSEFKEAQNQLIGFYHSDRAVKDASRLMRVPGFNHNKNEPILSTMLNFNPDLVYTTKEILEAHPCDKVKTESGLRIVESDADYHKFYEWVDAQPADEGSRHDTANRIAREAHALGCSPDEVYTAVQGYCEKAGTAHRQDGKEAELIVKWVVKNIKNWTPQLIDLKSKLQSKELIKYLEERKDLTELYENIALLGKLKMADYLQLENTITKLKLLKKKEVKELRDAEVKKVTDAQIRQQRQRVQSDGGVIIDSAQDYTDIAQAYLETVDLRYYREEFYYYEDGVYVPRPAEEVKAKLWAYIIERVSYIDRNTGFPTPYKPDSNALTQIELALRSLRIVPGDAELPLWLGKDHSNGEDIINFKNGILLLDSERIITHTPKLFSVSQLAFDYEPESTCESFKQTMLQWFPNDTDSIILVQKIIGYLLSTDTSLQKFFMFIGGSRTGKSTLGYILSRLIPQTTFTSLSHLGSDFGLHSMVNKQLAVVGDAHIGFKADSQIILDRLKGITGEDAQLVNRKNKSAVDVKLGTRILIITNQMYSFTDPSGALAKRLIPVCFDTSFEGKEDTGLKEKLESELPGICAWGIKGLKRLLAEGFNIPNQSHEIIKSMAAMNSPVGSFFAESLKTVDDKESFVTVEKAFEIYNDWCNESGCRPLGKNSFLSHLRSFLGKKFIKARKRVKGKTDAVSVLIGVTE